MKRLDADGNPFHFLLSPRENQLLTALLEQYPVAPAPFQKLGNIDTARMRAAQQVLEEALAERRLENQKQLQNLLHTEGSLRRDEAGYRLTLTGPQMTWLLEVLNEVRVGSWLNLGKPDNLDRVLLAQDEANARSLWSMELSGYFQMALLAALNQTTR